MANYRATGIQDRFQGSSGEEAVRQAGEFAEMVIDSVRESLLILDLDLRVQAANQSFYDHFQTRPDETVGRLVYELGNGQWDIPELHRLLEQILPEDKAMNDFEVQHDFPHIGRRVMLLNARQVDHHDLILLAIEDVTERRRTEETRRRSEARYRAALRNSPVVFACVDDALRYEWIFNSHPDFDPTAAIGKRDDELDTGPGVDALVALKRHVLDTGQQERREITFSRSNGTRTYDITATPVRDEDGQVQKLITASLDVSERKQIKQERDREHELLQTVLETLPIGIVIADAEGQLVRDNAAARELWGVPLEADSWSDYDRFVGWWPDTGERIQADEWAVTRAIRHGESTQGELIRNQKFDSKEQRYYLNNVAPMYDEEGHITGAVAGMLDVTERVEAENELEALTETLEERVNERTLQVRQLAARLAQAERQERHRISLVLHDDLQQRLYAIGMKLSMLKAQCDAGNQEAVKEQAKEIHSFVDEAINATRRLSTNMSPPVLKNEGLREAVSWLGSEMQRMHGLTVEIEADGEERVTDEDLRVLLFQVVRELLFNVVKHAGVDAARVYIRHSEEAIRIRVSDEGQGFDPDRAVPQDSEAFRLADARKRLQLVDGTLEIESAPGEGTRVVVQVPTSPVELYP
jgi:signal transduction histidine kinase